MTTATLLSARLVLAVVFGLAGASKLVSRDGLRDTLADFGLPRSAARLGAVALPPAELAVALSLLATAGARWGSACAIALLTVFCVAIGRSLLRGERPACGCIGRIHSTPVGVGTLVRNGVLAALALLVAVAGPGTSLVHAVAGVRISAVVAVLGALVVAQSWFAWELFRQHGRLLMRVRTLEGAGAHGLAVGELAPIPSDGPAALVFSSAHCGACKELRPQLDRFRRAGLELVVVEDDHVALQAFRIPAVPSAVLVDGEGRIASETVTGTQAVEALLATVAPSSEDRLLAVAR